MADFILENIGEFNDARAKDIVFEICWTVVQGILEFSVVELTKIAKLKIPLSIDYIFEENEDS